MSRHRSAAASIVVPLVIGSIALSNEMRLPRFANLHVVDVLLLIASGMCFGLGLSALLRLIRNRPTYSGNSGD